jgi:hypothetical protein
MWTTPERLTPLPLKGQRQWPGKAGSTAFVEQDMARVALMVAA